MRCVRALGFRSPAPAGYERSHDAFPLDVGSEDRGPDRRWQAAQKPASRRLPFPPIGKPGHFLGPIRRSPLTSASSHPSHAITWLDPLSRSGSALRGTRGDRAVGSQVGGEWTCTLTGRGTLTSPSPRWSRRWCSCHAVGAPQSLTRADDSPGATVRRGETSLSCALTRRWATSRNFSLLR